MAKLEYGIKANIPMIIQGFTSAGKSFLSTVASKINKRECISTALSEHTTIEDLLGRDIIKDDSSIKFIPGILLLAYKNGKTLILDECDLAKPEILSCILGSISKNELIICNQTFRKMDGYNVILTMNGEVKGFNEKQRNILTSNILTKFNLIQFDEMEKEECQEIFKRLLNASKEKPEEYMNNINNFIDIYQLMINEMKNKEDMKKNTKIKTIDPIVTLRNLKYCCFLSMNNVHPRIAAELSFTARFPKDERLEFENILNKFGKVQEDKNLYDEIDKNIKNNFLYYNNTYKKVIYLSLIALESGLHPLLIGEKGCGLTTLAKLIASIINKNYEFLLCSSETSVEDLIGCFQPQIKSKNKLQELSKYIKWYDGPVPRAGKNGVPLILDNINYSKPQVIECLNPLLEDNSKYNNVEYNILEKENEGPIQIKKGFSIIGTMTLDKDNKNSISKALMNRFVAIYIDNDFEINNENLNIIIENTGKKIDAQIKEKNNYLEQKYKDDENEYNNNNNHLINEEEENEENEDDEIEEDENNEDDYDEDLINEDDKNKENSEWFNIKGIKDETILEIKKYFNTEKINFKDYNFKMLIKKISKLAIVFERINKFGFSMKDCDDFINLKFNVNENKEKNEILQKNILLDSKEEKNKFFFDDFNSDAWKMIMSLISCNISNTSIFFQGSPGSGKSCAARHFGAYRIFQNRNPVITVNCNRDLKFDYLVGNYNFKNSKFDFVDGPLLTAMKKGECILLDEFNLCPQNVLINLLPIFKANINDEIYLKGVPESIKIKPGFLLIATGNPSKEKGRNILSSMILDEIETLEIKSVNLMTNISLIENILKNEYNEIYQDSNSFEIDKISAEQIKQLDKILKEDIQFKLTLRHIKCLLERIIRFCTEENYNVEGFQKIPVIYVILSYIIPQLKIGKKLLNIFLEKLDKIMKYNNLKELLEFIESKVEFEPGIVKIRDKKEPKNFIKKGKIYLITNMEENCLPQVALQTYFWIRMTCSLKSESPSTENILLAGITSYKEYLLKYWLSIKLQKDISIDSFSLTKNTETETLIGTSALDDENKLDIKIKNLIDNAIIYFNLDSTGLNEDDYEAKFKLIKKNKRISLDLHYQYETILKFKQLKNSFNRYEGQIGLKTVTSFNLGIVSKDFILGKKLILKGIENPDSSVIERLNPILENPRHLIITEDNQEIYNDDKIFKKIYKNNIKSIPMNDSFRIFFTSREVFQAKLSKALTSRLTIINCPSYDNQNYLIMKLNPEENYKKICESIVRENSLIEEIINFNKIISKFENIEFLRFITWCKTTEKIYNKIKKTNYKTILYSNDILNIKYIIGISALRSIIDRFENKYREEIIKIHFKDYLPEKLFNLLTSEFNNNLESLPLEVIENEGKKYIVSIYSGIILEFPENEIPNINSLNDIKWTKSSVDIADAIMVALISNTILVLEGPPGRGKTAISKAIYNYLNIEGENLKRINFSPSTIIEDVFARTIPKIDGEKVSTERKVQGLLSILENSRNSEKYYKHGLILDEINLSSDILLEYLYSYLDCILKQEDYISPDAIKYQNIGNIGVIATMNDAKLSNSRTSLSNSFLSRCHTFKLPDYSPNEKLLLAEKIFDNVVDKDNFMRIMTCFQEAEVLAKKYSDFGGNTFREILKLKQFIDKCKDISTDYLLELILSGNIPESEMENFQKKHKLNMVSNLNELKLKFKDNHLCFDKFVKYKLKNPKKYDIKEQFTIPQKEALMKMMIGLLAERPILLTGDIGTGKTFIVEQLANLIGVNLKVIQFNSETTSSDIIGRLELTVDQKKISNLRKSMAKFIDLLIDSKYKKITEIIVENESLDILKLKSFLEREKDEFCNYTVDIINESENIKNQLDNLIGIKKTHFNFKLSALVNAMKEGNWVLLDDINFAPQEIEGLMSLLEEESTLKIYENDPVLFFTKDESKITNKKTDFKIHPDFRLIMTTSKDTNISLAIKSRCVCIKIKPFKEAKDYAELIANNLKYSDIDDNNIVDIAKKLGNAFYKLKQLEEPSNYILKNYILSSVNLVNISKLILFLQPINDKKLAQIIEFCIFSPFKKCEKKNKFIEDFKLSLREDTNFAITPIRNIKRSHEYYLKMCEIYIFSCYYKNNNRKKNEILKDMNEKLQEAFEEKDNDKKIEIKENIIDKNIDEDKIINEIPRKHLLENIESFTLLDIKNYIADIDEVIKILSIFLEEKHKLFKNLYFLIYLKKILEKLNEITEDKLEGIKINNMECDKNYFLKYNKNDKLAEKYKRILIYFKNMMFYFEKKIIPKEISVLDLENSIYAIYYKYYKKIYKGKDEKELKNYFPFLLLSNKNLKKNLRDKIKNLEINFSNNKLGELYKNLKLYDKEINFDINTKEIDIKNILKAKIKNIDIKNLKRLLNIPNNVVHSKNYFDDKIIIYYYPNSFYKEENLIQIFFFFNLFIGDYIEEEEIKAIIPNDLYEFNTLVKSYFNENTIYSNNGEKNIFKKKFDFEDILVKGYKLLYTISNVQRDNINFNGGNNLFGKNNAKIKEENIDIVLETIDMIKQYLNIEKLPASIEEKYKILEERKKQFIFDREKNELKRNLIDLQTKYKDILIDETYEVLNQEIEDIKSDLDNQNYKNEEKIKDIENKLEKIKKSKEFNEENPKDLRREKNISIFAKIWYNYSKLLSIIEEFKNINLDAKFLNKVYKFQSLLKKENSNILLFAVYKKRIFSECKDKSFVSTSTIKIFNHIANSYLISKIVKNHLENSFLDNLEKVMMVEEKAFLDINNIFIEREYIYFPKLNLEDIKYCFSYAEDVFKSGELNPTIRNDIDIEENVQSKDEYLNSIKGYFIKKRIDDGDLNQIKSYCSKIDILYNNIDKIEAIKNNIDIKWLINPLEDLKSEAIKYPNKIIMKYKYGYSKDSANELFNDEKILMKALQALYEGKKNIPTVCKEKSLLNIIINEIKNSNKKYEYGYRIMKFYGCNLFEDNQTRTMNLIIETINDILKNLFKNLTNSDIINILKNVYNELLDLVFSTESPKFEETNATMFFEILFYSFLKKFKSKYEETTIKLKENKSKFLKATNDIKNGISTKINYKKNEYERKYKKYENDKKRFEQELKTRANKYYNENYNNKNFFKKSLDYFIKQDKVKLYMKTEDFKNWRKGYNLDKPLKDDNWVYHENTIRNIQVQMNKLENEEDINEIHRKIINIKNQLDFPNINNYIEKNNLSVFLGVYKEVNLNIGLLKKISLATLFLNKNIPNNIKLYEISENDIETIYGIISQCENNSHYYSLFKIKKIAIPNINITNYNLNNIYAKQDSNFIFIKENNKPVFLNKTMKINLGLYILGSELKNIGSVSIKNNYNNQLKYSINQNPKNDIIAYINITKELDQLNPRQNLDINFKLNIEEEKAGFYRSKFELILFFENKEFDKCEINVFINIIPLIIKFSLPNEKYSFADKTVSIRHEIKSLTIYHSFPSNLFSQGLGIKFLSGKNKCDLKSGDKENKGEISITPKPYENEEDINLEFNLNLLSTPLLYFKISYKNSSYLSLRIFDEKNIDINKIYIMKNMKKSIYLFNMSNETINLQFSYNKDEIELKAQKLLLNSKEVVKVEIKNINIRYFSVLKLNNKSIIIENIEKPSLKINRYSNSNYLEFNWDNYDKIAEEDREKMKLIIIDRNFNIKSEQKFSNYKYEFNILSSYFIFQNDIIEKEIINCNALFHNNFKIDENFEFSIKFTKDKMKITIYNINEEKEKYNCYLKYEKKNNFRKTLKDNSIKLISKKLKDINETLGKILKQNINLSDENSILNMHPNEKTSIENIIIFFLKYSLKFQTSDEFREFLQKIYNNIYKTNRKIKEFFKTKLQDNRIKFILENVAYIFSFLIIILFPSEILEYEYQEDENNQQKNQVKFDIKNCETFKKMKSKFEEYMKELEKDNILNKDLIYFNGEISLHDENDEFSKYEKEIIENENKIKIDEKNEGGTEEFVMSCYNEINQKIDDINNDNINISNLLSFLESSKQIVMKVPFILTQKDKEKEIKACVNGIKIIKTYLDKLCDTNIKNSKFRPFIEKCWEVFNNFNEVLDSINTGNKNKLKNIHIDCTTKCALPLNNRIENISFNKSDINRNRIDAYNDQNYIDKMEMEQYNPEILENGDYENYENKKDINVKKKEDDIQIVYKVNKLNLNEQDRKYITMEGILDEHKINEDKELDENKQKAVLKKDLTDYDEEEKVINMKIKNIKELFGDPKCKTATTILKQIISIVGENGKKYSAINDIDKINDLKYKFDESDILYNPDLYSYYSKYSSRLQNIISNIIRKKILVFNENEILPQTLNKSYLDILIDISATMSEDQRAASLLLCFGLSLAFSKYGVKIRISVFSERNNVWALTKEFSNDNLKRQLGRLRDALSFKARITSFPAEALKKLKNDFILKYENKKYCQILISNLISSQIVEKSLNWNDLGQRIIVFGLKSIFEEEFLKENKNIYEDLLKIPSSDANQIIQEFFETTEIITQFDKINEKLSDPFSNLINATIDTLLDKNEEIEVFNIRDIIINRNNYLNNKKDENNIENLKILITSNLKEQKYFSQNIPFSTMNLSKVNQNIIPQNVNIPTSSELEKISQKNIVSNKNSLDEIISYIINLLTPLFRQIMPSNIATGKIPCTSGGSLSIQGIKKWICSGFTYTYIFEKQGGKNKKKYNLSYVIDLSKSSLLLFNYSHCIATIILLLIAPSTVEDNEDIYIDVIINTIEGVKIVDFNSKCTVFQNISKINEIINIINEEINYSCCPGSCTYTAHKLLSERREDKKIFLITDSFVSDINEIKLVLNLIENCENEGIELVVIGVGAYPNGIKEVYPNCCYAPSIRNLQDALFSCFNYSKESFSNSLESNLIKMEFDDEIKKKLLDILNEKPKDKELENSINNEDLSGYLDLICTKNSTLIHGLEKEIKNPEEEPYQKLIFDFRILVVILYLGNNEHDTNITTEIFKNNAGKSLEKKGFKYDIVYSYGEGIKKLSMKDNNNYCLYSELWLFCSKGDGSLPEKAEDKDSNKITTFLQMVADFNKKGGALFLFSDNYPFVLETNLLLKEYLFKEGEINFEMKGSYNNKDPKGRFIFEEGTKDVKNGYFQHEHFLPCPGKANIRLSLRIGLHTFSEGITLSYAEKIDNNKDYSPFVPFAYLSDPESKKPFILYYDPKIEPGKGGPIVVHGGFTSAFYDFEQTGTGRLVISIACWLMRNEENMYNFIRDGIVKNIPEVPVPENKNINFDKWIKINMFSILILDVSSSMSGSYNDLMKMTNKIITNQMKNKENEGVVILFASRAKTFVNGKYRLINMDDIWDNYFSDRGTDFYAAFKEAEKYISNKNKFINKRILFLTDGEASTSQLRPICNRMLNENFKINIVGFGNSSCFEHLRQFSSPNCFYTSTNFQEVETICINIFAAE